VRHRHPARRASALVALALALGVGGATTAAADPGGYAPFRDGPFGVHEPGVEWLAGSGVTAGCTTSTYCPNQPVTRAQMATFMHRLSGHADGTTASVDAATVGGRTAASLAVIDGFVRVTERVRRTAAVVDVEARCPSGTRALGGGGSIDGLYAQVTDTPTADGAGWAVVWVSTDHRTHEVDATVTVTCAPTGPVSASSQRGPSDAERAAAVDRLRDLAALRG
jgi:hypothetical protein